MDTNNIVGTVTGGEREATGALQTALADGQCQDRGNGTGRGPAGGLGGQSGAAVVGADVSIDPHKATISPIGTATSATFADALAGSGLVGGAPVANAGVAQPAFAPANAGSASALPPRLGGLGLGSSGTGMQQMVPAPHAAALVSSGAMVHAGGTAGSGNSVPFAQPGVIGNKELSGNLASMIMQRQNHYQEIIRRGGQVSPAQMSELQQLITLFQQHLAQGRVSSQVPGQFHGAIGNASHVAYAPGTTGNGMHSNKRPASYMLQQVGQQSGMAGRQMNGGQMNAMNDVVKMQQHAALVAKQAYQQLVASGQINGQAITAEKKKEILNGFFRRALQQQQQKQQQQAFNLNASMARHPQENNMQPSNKAMRVSIDKRSRKNASATFNAEDTTKGDHTQEVFNRVSEITRHLRNELANKTRLQGAQNFDQVTQQMLIEACGSNARFLKGYQMIGINFLLLLYRTHVGGAILADEMGLGKTCQIISYLGAIATLDRDEGPHLVVVPASLLENWQRELHRWCPKLKSVVYYGKHRSVIRKRLKDLKAMMDAGIEVDDDLSDLQDADILADIAMNEKLAAEQGSDDSDDDILDDGADPDAGHESDQDYDERRDRMGNVNGKPKAAVPPPQRWNYKASLPKAPFNVLLTSYTLFERDSNEQRKDREFLESWTWSHIIMDEAHALKNKEAQRTTRLRRVAAVSRRRIMMTGTPLQNDLLELQNLMQFLLPQVFASKAEAFGDFADMAGDEQEVQKLTERMKQLLGPFVLRRLKTEVAGQLTEKKHQTKFIEMSEVQKKLYSASIDHMKSQINSHIKTPAVSSSAQGKDEASLKKFMTSVGARKISHLFSHLRKIAQHPLLVRSNYSDEDVEIIAKKAVTHGMFSGNVTLKKVTEELMSYSDFGIHALCYGAGPDFAMHRLTTDHMMSSCKFQFLAELLPKLKEAGSRPLIFSQWTSMLDIIEWLMEVLQLPYVRLDGSTAVDERLATVDRFNGSDDVFAFLLSTRAGGQGLNLTGADTVILHDVDFNPQIDRQAEDRCHRLGQTKPVSVYRLITRATVDQNIYGMSLRKLKLDHAVLDGITSGAGAKLKQNAQERQQMGTILRQLFNGEENYDEMAEQVAKMEMDAKETEAPKFEGEGGDVEGGGAKATGAEGNVGPKQDTDVGLKTGSDQKVVKLEATCQGTGDDGELAATPAVPEAVGLPATLSDKTERI